MKPSSVHKFLAKSNIENVQLNEIKRQFKHVSQDQPETESKRIVIEPTRRVL